MEFDKRITDISKIMNCFTVEEAKRYLYTSGYFADHIEDFAELDKLDMTELIDIEQKFKYPYSGYCDRFKFFLPCAFVKEEKEEKEKKYSPFILSEFLTVFPIGEMIRFRHKIDKLEKHLIFLGYKKNENGDIYIEIGNSCVLTLEELFKNYEWQKFPEEEYRPFGVEE